jgi:hypothetical protein
VSQAKRGARLLDLRMPGWHERIDTDELNINHAMCCILAQAGGDWGSGLTKAFGTLKPGYRRIFWYGFSSWTPFTAHRLERRWIREIEKRKTPPPLVIVPQPSKQVFVYEGEVHDCETHEQERVLIGH